MSIHQLDLSHTKIHVKDSPLPIINTEAHFTELVPITSKNTNNNINININKNTAIGIIPDYFTYLRLLRSVWTDLPTVHIEWRSLSYVLPVPIKEQSTNIFNAILSISSFFRSNPTINFHALRTSDGILRPGTSTLVLAPPGGGKSFLLKALSGRLASDPHLHGTIRYNGLTATECKAASWRLEKLCHYVDQGDIHLALLTVKETIQFALDCSVSDPIHFLGSGIDVDDIKDLQRLHKQKANLIIELLGLKECEKTILGNDLLRGVSGGQRKRTSVGEAIITNARFLALDEITSGLDSSAAYDVNKALRDWAQLMNGTILAALLQPTPEIYSLYDNVILLRSGTIIYSGPRTDVLPYLETLGFHCPPDQDEADFLVEWLAHPRHVWERGKKLRVEQGGKERADCAGKKRVEEKGLEDQVQSGKLLQSIPSAVPGINNSISFQDNETGIVTNLVHHRDFAAPRTTSTAIPFSTCALRDCYLHSSTCASLSVFLLSTSSQQGVPQHSFSSPTFSSYTTSQFRTNTHSFLVFARLCLSRQWKVMGRNTGFIGPRILQSVIMGVIMGSLFYQLSPSEFTSRLGLFLFAQTVLAFGNMAELATSAEAKSVVYKQHDRRMYPTLAYIISVVLVHLTVATPETMIFGSILYFMSGHVLDVGRYFFYLLVLFCLNLCMSKFFRFVAYVTRNADIAQSIAGPSTAACLMFSGFLITFSKIPNYLIEFFYLSPFSWCLRSLAQNEFLAPRYDEQQFNSQIGALERMGDIFLETWQISTNEQYRWAGIGYLLGLFTFLSLVSAWALATLRFPLTVGTKRRPEDDVEENEEQLNKIAPSVRGIEIKIASAAAEAREKGEASADGGDISAVAKRQAHERSSYGSTVPALPFVPMDLCFRDLKYTVQVSDPKNPKHMVPRVLLNGINGYIKAGTLTALMGSSGSGKTTLLDVIAGRKTTGIIEGSCLINGHPKVDSTFLRICGYVEQNDIHSPQPTVREALRFSARLKLPETVSEKQRLEFVEEVIEILELKHLAERRIGDDVDLGLSPAQRKLVTIGVELVSNPTFLFLDEPTSGLDSHAALTVMRVVKRVATTGRSVICTIHQPSAALFYSFDRLLLLRSGGVEVYFGPIGEYGSQLVSYFESVQIGPGFVQPKLPLHTNPATWMFDVIGAGTGSHQKIPGYGATYAQSELKRENMKEIEGLSKPAVGSLPAHFSSEYSVSTRIQFNAVVYRLFQSYYRNTGYNLARWFILLIQGTMFGVLYLQINVSDQAGLISKLSAIFTAVITTGVTNCASTVPILYRNRAVYYRERASFMYSSYCYSIGIGVVELPYVFIGVVIFLLPFYFMVGFVNDATLFFQFLLSQYLVALMFNFWGQFLVALLPNILVIGILQGVSFSLLFLFGGIFLTFPAIPQGWIWLYYIDFIPKGLVTIAVTQFKCDGCATVSVTTGSGSPIDETPQDYINNYYLGRGSDVYWPWIGYSLLTLVVLRVLIMLTIQKVNHLKR